MEEKSHVGMMNCWICGEGAQILLDRTLRQTLSHDMGSLPNVTCSTCESQAKENDAIWLISVRDGEVDKEDEIFNPYRTGQVVLVKKHAIIASLESALVEEAKEKVIEMVKKNIYFYLDDSTWDAFGLPRNEVNPDEL